ncbi:hypothetical protein ElyMa_002781700 [Elysia marginata]|uniref:Uncharacterized protein n=1 Tax=Elysia marginata TaxID=1093978 RepID=A0AAV4HP47_9GAST|nr:hypothetical protein ElyMa_002781700 [Elysia marginata]
MLMTTVQVESRPWVRGGLGQFRPGQAAVPTEGDTQRGHSNENSKRAAVTALWGRLQTIRIMFRFCFWVASGRKNPTLSRESISYPGSKQPSSSLALEC